MKALRTLVYVWLLVPALALAGPGQKSADEWYKEGETQYNLGNFDAAADAFKQGFALESLDAKKPSYLYNIAQAYRQEKKCSDAAFFYKRYLSLKDQDTAKPLDPDKRKEIEGWIAELDQCASTATSVANKQPDSTVPAGTNPAGHPQTTGNVPTGNNAIQKPTGTAAKPTTTADGSGGDNGESGDDDTKSGGITKSTTAASPSLFTARLTAGVGKVSAGSVDTVPIQGTVSLFLGYPIQINDQLEVDVGLAGTYTPIPFDNGMTGSKETGSMLNGLVDVGVEYYVAPAVGLRLDAGAGVLAFAGISSQGNPFTMGGAPTNGALGMFAARAALSVDYKFSPNFVVTATPFAFTYSPAKTGLRGDISSITSIDFMVGIGYRM